MSLPPSRLTYQLIEDKKQDSDYQVDYCLECYRLVGVLFLFAFRLLTHISHLLSPYKYIITYGAPYVNSFLGFF